MATLASSPIRWIADQWENHCGYSSAVLSGILPDERHKENGGFHCSIEDLIRYGNQNDYSNTRPDDKGWNPQYGAAVDMSMSPADMRKCHDRVRRVWADTSDPRRKYINAINTWDGDGDAVRLDFYAGTAKYASPDHKWHNHAEERRRYLLDWTAAKAIVSVLKGETKATYLASISQEDDTVTPAQFAAILKDPTVATIMRAIAWQYVGGGIPAGYSTLKVLNEILATVKALGELVARESSSPEEVRALLAELSAPEPLDSAEVVAGVLAGLSPEAIAAAIPSDIADRVADELSTRLAPRPAA